MNPTIADVSRLTCGSEKTGNHVFDISATASSGTPYFTQAPGDQYRAWDASATFDWMPRQFVTFRAEFNHRFANVPYFSGSGGITPTTGNTGSPGSIVPGFTPDLVNTENRYTLAILVKI